MALPQAGVELVANGLSGFVSDMNKAGDAVTNFGKSGDTASKGFGGFQEIVTGALREVGALAVDAMGKAAQAVGSFVKDSIGLAGDFQQGMLEFQAVAGKDVDTKGLEKFQDLFLQLGKELPVSTSDVQKAAIELVKGGIDPATIAAGGLESSIKFAAAAMDGDLVGAATISAKVVGGWADVNATAAQKSELLAHAQDILTKAANASTVGVDDLSLGLYNVQGTAKSMGVSLDETITTLAELAPSFSNANTAGTAYRNFLIRLQPTTQPAIDAMTALGLITEDGKNKFFDAQGAFVGTAQASQILQDAFKGLTAEQRTQLSQTIFGNDAMNAAIALAERGAAGYDGMTDSLTKANGVAENAALKQQGFNTAIENAKGSVEALQITIGSALLPMLTDLLNNVIAPAVNTFTDMASAVFGNQEAFDRLSPAAQSVVSTVQMLVGDVQNIIGAFQDAGAGSSEFATQIGDLANDLGLPGDLIQDIILGVQDLVSWFNQGGGAADTLGGAVDDLSGIWQEAIKVVEDVAGGYEAIIKAVLPVVTGFIDAHGAEISAFFKTTWDTIISIIRLALQVYDSIVPPVLKAIAGFIEAHGSEIQKVLKGAWDLVTSIITGALNTIKGVIQLALDLIHGDWSKAWADIKGIIDTQVTAIQGAVTGLLNMIAGLFNTSMGDIKKTWQDNWDMLVTIAGKVVDRMVQVGADIVDGILSGLRNNWDSLMGWVQGKVKGLVDAALSAIGAGSPAKDFMPVGEFAIQGIIVGAQAMAPALSSLIEQIATSMIAGLTKNKEEMSKKLSEAADALIEQARSLAQDINSAIADGFSSTASIDRQIAKNLDRFKDVLPEYQQYTEGALKQAEITAKQFTDPTEGAKFFRMRSDQILEYAKLQKELAEAETSADKERIKQQMLLINAAQTAEISAFDAEQQAKKSPAQSIADAFQQIMSNQAIKLPGILENPLIAQLSSLIAQLQQPAANPWANPPMTAQQLYGGGGTTTSYNSTQNWNMPIYTNQSPSVLTDSMAIAQASMT